MALRARIVGMDVAESQTFLAELAAHATEDRFVYRHRWQVGDLIFWDNRATMHKATPYDDVRYKPSFGGSKRP